MKRTKLSILLMALGSLLISSVSYAVEIGPRDTIDFLDFEDYQYKVSSADFQKALDRLTHPSFHYKENLNFLTDNRGPYAVQFLRNPDEPVLDEENPNILYTLHFGQQTTFTPGPKKCFNVNNYDNITLNDLNIILDPGHMDEEFADLDDRRVNMVETGHTFTEARLNLFTAYALKKMLEEKGARVLLTRTKERKTTIGMSFEEWSSDYENIVRAYQSNTIFKQGRLPVEAEQIEALNWFLEPDSIMYLFKLYAKDERWARQAFINQEHAEFSYSKADLFLSIHYNGMHIKHDDHGKVLFDPKNEEGQNIGHDYNYNMGFVPGSFMANSLGVTEIEENHSKYHFLRQILNNGLIDDSIDFCNAIIDELARSTGVKKAVTEDAFYLRDFSKQALNKQGQKAQGVFHRNIDMTRMVNIPVCAAEALIQDNFNESAKLSRYDENEIDGLTGPNRAVEVARGFYEGIVRYAKQRDCSRL